MLELSLDERPRLCHHGSVTVSSSANLAPLSPEAHARALAGTGRARAVWDALRAGRAPEEAELGARARELVRTNLAWPVVRLRRSHSAPCGTLKLEVLLGDDAVVETVLIPSNGRTTVCVSTQVGCARACGFCMTATLGLRRNLSACEIVGQVWLALGQAQAAGLPTVRNVVYMGMGEPLDNLAAVRASLDVLTSPQGFRLAPRHVTVSTVGTHPTAIAALAHAPAQVAWSVHAADDVLRRRLVPTTRHSMSVLRDAFLSVMRARGDHLFVEVTLVRGVNDSDAHALALTELLAPFGPGTRINLLPMNPGRVGYEATAAADVARFQRLLREQGFLCYQRTQRGDAHAAACGQLAGGAGAQQSFSPEHHRAARHVMLALRSPKPSSG